MRKNLTKRSELAKTYIKNIQNVIWIDFFQNSDRYGKNDLNYRSKLAIYLGVYLTVIHKYFMVYNTT